MKMTRNLCLEVVNNPMVVCIIADKIVTKKEFIEYFDRDEEPDVGYITEGNVSIELTEEVELGQHIKVSNDDLKICDESSESFGVVVGDSKEGTPVIHLLRGAVIFKWAITRTVRKYGANSEFTQEIVDDKDFEKILERERTRLKGQAEKFMLDKGYRRTTEVRLVGGRDAVVGGCSEDCGYCGKHTQRIIPYLLVATVRGFYVGKKEALEQPFMELKGQSFRMPVKE